MVGEFGVEARDFAVWSSGEKGQEGRWVVEAGEYDFSIGRSAADLVATQRVAVDRVVEGP